jgi:hypothetical protein
MTLTALMGTNTVIRGDLNSPLSPINRSSRQKISNENSDKLQTLGQTDMVNIYRVFHPTLGKRHYFLQLMELSPK